MSLLVMRSMPRFPDIIETFHNRIGRVKMVFNSTQNNQRSAGRMQFHIIIACVSDVSVCSMNLFAVLRT